jgi:hypothetical protein
MSLVLAIALVAMTATCHSQEIRASDVLAGYVRASGGEAAMRRVSTRVMTGFIVTPGGRAPLEIIQAEPSRFLRIIDSPVSGHSENGYDGTVAWSKNSEGVREMTGPPVEMVVRELHLHRPLVLSTQYVLLDAPKRDTVGGVAVYVISATTPDSTRETLYFDRSSGLLAGWDVSVGSIVLQTRLEDYRNVDGILLPFRIRRARPDFTWSEEFSQIRHNVPVESARFSKPAP